MASAPLLTLVSLHSDHNNKTPGDDFPRVEASSPWTPAELPLDALIDHISSGKAFVNALLDGGRSNDNCIASNLIILDVDGDMTLDEFWAIPFAQRHCAFTYTSCSHLSDTKQQERGSRTNHSFRALFPAERLDLTTPEGQALYAERYHLLVERLGISLKDNSPAKPAQLWFGNDAAAFQLGQSIPLDWEFSADAADRLNAKALQRQQLQQQAAPRLDDDGLDERRAVYLLDHLLRPSADGDFSGGYWVKVLNACAASGSDAVREAFLAWHGRGHHYKTQKGVARRYDKAGHRSGLGALFALAKEQHGSEWYKLLPPELQRKGQAPPPPISLMSSRSRDDIAPQQDLSASVIPNAVSSATLERITYNLNVQARAQSHDGSRCHGEDPAEFQNTLLWRIYRLEVELIHEHDGIEEPVDEARGMALQLDYRNQLASKMMILARESWRIDQCLLEIFRQKHSLDGRSKRNIQPFKLSDHIPLTDEWLIPDLMMAGCSYMLYGLTGTGKSTMALMIARVVTGTPDHSSFLDYEPVPSEVFGSRRVLYIASDGEGEAVTDLKAYAKRHLMQDTQWCEQHMRVIGESSCNNGTVWRMNLFEMHLLAEFLDAAAAEGNPYVLVIFDSLKAICPDHVRVGDQVITDYIKILIKLCSKRGVATLFIHHQGKETATYQGAAGIGEMISGIFSIKKKDEQHHFCVEKTRVSLRGNRDLPYTIKDGHLILVNQYPNGDNSTDEDKILAILQEHYDRHRRRVAHLDSTDPMRQYSGMSRDDLRIALSQRGGSGKRIHARPTGSDLLETMKSVGTIRIVKSGRNKNYAAWTAESFCDEDIAQLNLAPPSDVSHPGWD